jgi:hypothetical protein
MLKYCLAQYNQVTVVCEKNGKLLNLLIRHKIWAAKS